MVNFLNLSEKKKLHINCTFSQGIEEVSILIIDNASEVEARKIGWIFLLFLRLFLHLFFRVFLSRLFISFCIFLQGIDEESILIIDKASEVEEELMQGKLDGVEEKLEPMYKIMAKDLIKQRSRLGGNWAIAQAVFSRKQRELLRSIIGPDLVFIVISMTKECNAERIKKRGNMGEYERYLLVPFDSFKNLMFSTFLCIDQSKISLKSQIGLAEMSPIAKSGNFMLTIYFDLKKTESPDLAIKRIPTCPI